MNTIDAVGFSFLNNYVASKNRDLLINVVLIK